MKLSIAGKKKDYDFEWIEYEAKHSKETYLCTKYKSDLIFHIDLNNLKIFFKDFVESIGDLQANQLMLLDGEEVPFQIDSITFFYTWHQFYFSMQTIYLLRETGSTKIGVEFLLPDDESHCWHYKYSPLYFLSRLDQLKSVKFKHIKTGDHGFSCGFKIEQEIYRDETVLQGYNSILEYIPIFEENILNQLEGFKWKEVFDTDEPKFTKEVLIPLLRKMKYDNVKYNHGSDEYGRDVLFSERNKFGKEINFGIQVKAGDVSGGANSEIDALIGQLNDAFDMPFKRLGENEEKYVSTFIIAISGNFKKNAKEKILNKIEKWNKQNVSFWDKSKIIQLIEKYWNSD